jgi:hypothetical protein
MKTSNSSQKALITFCLAVSILAMFPASSFAEETPDQRFIAMRAAFDQGDFAKSQQMGEALIKDKHLSPELFQLLGHTRYRLGDLGQAALWYKRSALFPPPVPEVRQNIAHLHDRTGNVSFPSNGFRDQLSARLARSQWMKLAIICGWVIVISLTLIALYVGNNGLRTLLLTSSTLALVIGVIALFGWNWHPSYQSIRALSLVTTPNTKAYTAASSTSGAVVELRVGSEVRKLEDRGQWCYVEIPTDTENRRGWVLNSVLSPLWAEDLGAAVLE